MKEIVFRMENKETTRICFACDLKDDPALIEEYKNRHSPGSVWPGIISRIKDSGIIDMQIYCISNRLFMVLEVNDTFDSETKAKKDAENPAVREWEEQMWKYQQQIPGSPKGLKWVEMDKIFQLD